MGKYEPLQKYLLSATDGKGPAKRMSFREIEDVLGGKLPASAYQYEAWWSNNAAGHSHAQSWLDVGFRTEEVDLAGRKVTFRRSRPGEAPSQESRDPWGCMGGTVTFVPGVDLTEPSGERWKAAEGRLLNE